MELATEGASASLLIARIHPRLAQEPKVLAAKATLHNTE
jgi:hypothetical protein